MRLYNVQVDVSTHERTGRDVYTDMVAGEIADMFDFVDPSKFENLDVGESVDVSEDIRGAAGLDKVVILCTREVLDATDELGNLLDLEEPPELPTELPPTNESVDLSLLKHAARRLEFVYEPTWNQRQLELIGLNPRGEARAQSWNQSTQEYVSDQTIRHPSHEYFSFGAAAEFIAVRMEVALQGELRVERWALFRLDESDALPDTLPPTNESLDLSLVKRARTLKHVGVFAKLPEELAKQFPSLGDEDPSPPHVTVLYVGDLPEEKYEDFLDTVRMVCSEIDKPLKAKLDGLGKFEHNDKGQRVWFVKIESEGLHHLHKLLEKECEAIGVLSQSDHKEYVPHATLEYQNEPGEYKGEVPTGEWQVKEVEVWKGEGEGPVVKVASVLLKRAAQDGYDPQVLEDVVNDVAKAKRGDVEAKERLVDRFSSLMWSIVHKAPIQPQDWNDAYQELYTAFDRAIRGYDKKTNVPFYAYLKSALENEALRHAERFSRPREREISLDLPATNEEGEETTLGDTLMSTTIPPDIYAQVRDIYNKVHNELAGRDRYVFEQLTAKGLSPVEIVRNEQWGRYDPLSLPGLRRIIRDHILPVVKKYKQLYVSGSVVKRSLNEEARDAVETALEKDKTAQGYLILDVALSEEGFLGGMYLDDDVPRQAIPSKIRQAVAFIETWAPFSAESAKPILEGYLAARDLDKWQQLDKQWRSLRWPLQQEIYENYFHAHEGPTRVLKNELTRKTRVVKTLKSFDAWSKDGKYDEEAVEDAANELYEANGSVQQAIRAIERDVREKETELADPELDQEDKEDATETLHMYQQVLPLLEAYQRYLGMSPLKGQLPTSLPPTAAGVHILKVGSDGSRTRFTKVSQRMGALVNSAIRTFRANKDPLTREMMLDIIGKAMTEHGDLISLEEEGVETLDIKEVFLDALAGGDVMEPDVQSPALIEKAREVIAQAFGEDVVEELEEEILDLRSDRSQGGELPTTLPPTQEHVSLSLVKGAG